eukprot:765660-Hanusia_phi.AAC.5
MLVVLEEPQVLQAMQQLIPPAVVSSSIDTVMSSDAVKQQLTELSKQYPQLSTQLDALAATNFSEEGGPGKFAQQMADLLQATKSSGLSSSQAVPAQMLAKIEDQVLSSFFENLLLPLQPVLQLKLPEGFAPPKKPNASASRASASAKKGKQTTLASGKQGQQTALASATGGTGAVTGTAQTNQGAPASGKQEQGAADNMKQGSEAVASGKEGASVKEGASSAGNTMQGAVDKLMEGAEALSMLQDGYDKLASLPQFDELIQEIVGNVSSQHLQLLPC